MSARTGFDKFTRKAMEQTGVSITVPGGPSPAGPPSREERARIISEAAAGEGSAPESAALASAPNPSVPEPDSSVREPARRGRPVGTGSRRETVAINFKIDRDLKRRLEEIKFRTYRSSLTDLIVEAISDLVKKYD